MKNANNEVLGSLTPSNELVTIADILLLVQQLARQITEIQKYIKIKVLEIGL